MADSFGVYRRDTHHWDISTDEGRAFCIRGEPGKIYVRDERQDGRPFPRESIQFRSVPVAMAFCAEQLMFEDRAINWANDPDEGLPTAEDVRGILCNTDKERSDG
jgi:hypothetical protein